MTKLIVSLPKDYRKFFTRQNKMYWEEIALDSIMKHINKLELAENIASKSRLSEKDALEIGKQVKKGVAGKYKK